MWDIVGTAEILQGLKGLCSVLYILYLMNPSNPTWTVLDKCYYMKPNLIDPFQKTIFYVIS